MCICPEEFSFKRLKLGHPYVSAFATSPWLPLPLFLIYRLIVAFYLLSWLVFSGFADQGYWFLYLSNWVFTFVTGYFLLALFITTHYCCGDRVDDDPAGFGPRRFRSETYIVGLSSDAEDNDNDGEGTSYAKIQDDNELIWPHKTVWLLFTIASVNSLLVTIAYWSTVYAGTEIDGLSANLHIVGAAFMLLEVAISNVPIRLVHFLYSHIFGSIYVLATVIYWAAGGLNEAGQPFIYSVINYQEKPGAAVFAVFMMLIVVQFVLHVFLFGLFRFRAWLISKLM